VLLELRNPIEVETPFGDGLAILYHEEVHQHYWTVILKRTGALVQLPQRKVHVKRNYTLGIRMSDEEMRDILGEEK